jgi:hypothetical protein
MSPLGVTAPNALNCGFGAHHGVFFQADAMSSARMALKFEL